VEHSKGRLTGPAATTEDREVARAVLVHAFDHALRLLHPIVPFVTEALWQRLPGRAGGEFLTIAAWPTSTPVDEAAAREFALLQEAITAVRQVRSDYAVAPSKAIEATVVAPPGSDAATVLGAEAAFVQRLTRTAVAVGDAAPAGAAAHALLTGGAELVVPLAGIVDLARERDKLAGELAALEKQLGALRGRLANEGFVGRAPAQVVEAERQKEREWSARRDQLAAKVAALGAA
jgi:valyl-tRNA synthetase